MASSVEYGLASLLRSEHFQHSLDKTPLWFDYWVIAFSLTEPAKPFPECSIAGDLTGENCLWALHVLCDILEHAGCLNTFV